ncbi:hypothetical protein L3X38_006967 [Prunus dulcis]|uniref:Peptidase A1 domain-containing protein n=1 Tax=Prunus dulcis TaxID=3755 RepID=A0AAD4ZTX7_PRUDU|nr:hypothetical protein L3X38_006967 [Prunus dulcis]
MGFFSVFLFLILCSFEKAIIALAATSPEPHLPPHTTHTVEVNSLLPATTCTPSTKGHTNNKASILEVVHKHGPCSIFHKSSKTSTTKTDDKYHAQILKQDEARVNSIHSRLNYRIHDPFTQSAASTTLPAKSGLPLGSANYFVTVGLGTPAKQLSLEFDTGSDLTWTQCRPCLRSCYTQSEPIFDPSLSSSYKNLSCSSATCTQLSSAGIPHRCSSASSSCLYGIRYGDGSFSIGDFAKEKLTLTSTDVFEGFLFGCGQDNEGLFYGTAAPPVISPSATEEAPLTASSSPSSPRYPKESRRLGLAGIKVGGSQLSIAPSVFSSSGTIIDSGTVITRLPAKAYAALRGAFREAMKNYTLTKSFSLLDTCYNFSGYETVSYPKIAFMFGDGLTVDSDATGIFYVVSSSQVCLAFAGNKDDSDIGIIGNVQQKRLEVVYDVAGQKVGFAPASCP